MTYTASGVTEPSQSQETPRTLTTKLYLQLRHDILSCTLRPGDRVRLASLQERFSVSLSAVREALSRLASEGLITTTDQRGFRVSPVSMQDLVDLVRTRIQIESLALTQSIAHGDIAWESKITAALHTLSRLPRAEADSPLVMSEAWAKAHSAYHRALVEGCNSNWLLQFRDTLYEQTERYRRLMVYVEPTRDVMGEHRQLTAAVLSRDAPNAVKILEGHFSETAQILVRHFSHPPSTPPAAGPAQRARMP